MRSQLNRRTSKSIEQYRNRKRPLKTDKSMHRLIKVLKAVSDLKTSCWLQPLLKTEPWWTVGGSNSLPPLCKSGALPIELTALLRFFNISVKDWSTYGRKKASKRRLPLMTSKPTHGAKRHLKKRWLANKFVVSSLLIRKEWSSHNRFFNKYYHTKNNKLRQGIIFVKIKLVCRMDGTVPPKADKVHAPQVL